MNTKQIHELINKLSDIIIKDIENNTEFLELVKDHTNKEKLNNIFKNSKKTLNSFSTEIILKILREKND